MEVRISVSTVLNFFRNKKRTPETGEPEVDQELLGVLQEAIPEHLSRYLPGEPIVWHELISDHVPIHVYCWPPTPERDKWTLVTCGPSAHPMNVPEGVEILSRIELMMTLPGDWPLLELEDFPEDERDSVFWPIEQLKFAARVPHLMDTWLGFGHTLQAGQDITETYTGSEFSGMVVGGPVSVEDMDVFELKVAGTQVHFWGLYPLYAEELAWALENSSEAVLEKLEAAGYHEGVFPGRPSVV